MKFYFCETCGKRLTEKDIEGGAARNKKLKGVFCTECSVGVTTMDTLPMTKEQAKGIVAEEEAKSPSKRKTSSRLTLDSSRRQKPQLVEVSASGRLRGARPSGSSWQLWAAAGAGVVLLLIVAVAVWMGGSVAPPPKKVAESKSLAKKESTSKPGISPPEESTPKETVPESTDSPAETTPEVVKPSAPAEVEPDKQPATAEAPSVPAAQQRAQESAAEKAAEKKRAEEKLQQEKKDAEAAFEKRLDAFLAALGGGDLKGATRVAGEATDTEKKHAGARAEALPKLAGVLTARADVKQKALDGLLDGKTRIFRTNRGKIRGVATKLEGDTLRVKVTGLINGQSIEYVKKVKVSELTDAGRRELLGDDTPADPIAWAAVAAFQLAQSDPGQAERALGEVAEHPLKAALSDRLATKKAAALEAAAEAFWKEKLSPWLNSDKLKKETAEKVAAHLTAFAGDFKASEFFKTMEADRRKLGLALRLVLGPPPKKPNQISKLAIWLRADKGVKVDENKRVVSWATTREGVAAVIRGKSSRPLLIQDALNGLPMVYFNGTSDSMTMNTWEKLSPGGSQPRTVIVVLARGDAKGKGPAMVISFGHLIGNKSYSHMFRTSKPFLGTWYGSAERTSSFPATAQALVVTQQYDGTTDRMYVNGILKGEWKVSLGTDAYRVPPVIGSKRGTSQFYKGGIAEIVTYHRAISEEDRKAVERYLLEKWIK